MENAWPGGTRHAMEQDAHERWNAIEFPGTRQLCVLCNEPTERCEEDSLTVESIEGPLCEACYHKTPEWIADALADEQIAREEFEALKHDADDSRPLRLVRIETHVVDGA